MNNNNYGKGLTTNVDLERYAHYFGLPLVGIYSRDTLPTIIRDGYYILNTDYEAGEGKHWLCFGIEKNNSICWYFDSLAEKMLPEVYKFLHNPSRPIYYNKKRIQDDNSHYCGFACIQFANLMYSMKHSNMTIEKKMNTILNLFDNTYEKNRKTIVELINKSINEREKTI